MKYAVIANGIVANVIWLHPSNAVDFPNAVALGERAVQIGDVYANAAFFRGGEKVLSEEEDMAAALNILGVNSDDE